MGIEEDLKSDPPCHPRACAIQTCLQKNNYNEGKCQKLIDELYSCCDLFYQRHGDNASTTSCPKSSLLKLKLQQKKDGRSS